MTIEERDATRERVDANRFWNNGFVWDDVSVKSLRFEWLIPGGKQSCSRMNPCVHPSLHGALRRDYLFEHMVPRIRQDAMNKVRGSHAVLGRWALVGSCAFWAEMARVFAEQTVDAQELQALWAGVFDTAARHGNNSF